MKRQDYYRAAKCPKCGRFMAKDKETNEWKCGNPKCRKR